jgi:hypothetical protein
MKKLRGSAHPRQLRPHIFLFLFWLSHFYQVIQPAVMDDEILAWLPAVPSQATCLG